MPSVAGMRSIPEGGEASWRRGYLDCPILQVRKLRLGRESVAKSQTATPGRALRPVQHDRGMKKILASPQ